jgi:DNA-binding NtrC family response regulator
MESVKLKKLSGKIILVDDQLYEKGLLELALEEKGWEVQLEYFKRAEDALDYLEETLDKLFLIISDICESRV